MDNMQTANNYALACILGYDKTISEFKSEYESIYSKAITELNSGKRSTARAVKNPLKQYPI